MDEATLREKQDQELIELLNEIRVGLSGASVLFGFLLIVPFSAAWDDTTRAMRTAYVVSFLTTMLAVVSLMAPTVYHRLRWREHDKEHMLVTANRLTIAGSAFLALAMISVILLITDLLFSLGWAILATTLVAAGFFWFWYGLALLRRAER